MSRTRIFIDFWNFQINWNERTNRAKIDWPKLPQVLTAASSAKLSTAGVVMPLALEETRIYYSYNPAVKEDRNLRQLDGYLPGQATRDKDLWKTQKIREKDSAMQELRGRDNAVSKMQFRSRGEC